jgi:carboxylesterase
MRPVNRDSGSILIPGGDTGCVLLHSLAGSPGQMRPLAEKLAGSGYTVSAPVWPWSEDGLKRLHPHPRLLPAGLAGAWMEAAAAGVDKLSAECGRLFLIGLSLGALIALATASIRPLHGVVSIGCPAAGSDPQWRRQVLAGLEDIIPEGTGSLILDAVGRVAEKVGEKAGAISCPVFIVHSRADRIVPPSHATTLYGLLAAVDRTLLWLERSPHISTLGVERYRLAEDAANWIKKINSGAKERRFDDDTARGTRTLKGTR